MTSPNGAGRQVRDDSGSDQVDRDVDVVPRGFGIRTNLVRGVHQGAGDVALQTRQADVVVSSEGVSTVSDAQVHLGVDG
jgi:hypothetical protein